MGNMEQGESGAPEAAVDTPANDDFVHTSNRPLKVEEPKKVEAPKAEVPDAEDEAESPDGSETGKKPRRGGFQKKIAARDAEIARLLDENSKLKGTPSAPPLKSDSATEKPKPDNYQTYDDYVEALTDWKADAKATDAVKKEFENRDSKSREENFRKEMKAKADSYEEKVAKAKEIHADYDEVIEAYDGPLTVQMQQALLDSDIGPEVARYIALNPEEGAKLASMSIVGMNKAIGRIEALIEFGKQQAQPAAVKTTKAPPPIAPVKQKASVVRDLSSLAESGDYEGYRKARGFN